MGKHYFDQQTRYAAQVSWSKYTKVTPFDMQLLFFFIKGTRQAFGRVKTRVTSSWKSPVTRCLQIGKYQRCSTVLEVICRQSTTEETICRSTTLLAQIVSRKSTKTKASLGWCKKHHLLFPRTYISRSSKIYPTEGC